MTSRTLNVGRPLVVMILVTMIVVVGVGAWNVFAPATNMNYLLIVCPLICLEGLHSARLMRAQKLQSSDLIMFRAVELLALGFFLKLTAALISPDFIANLPVFDARIIIGALITAMLWYAMLDTAHDFKEIDTPPPPVMSDQKHYVSPVDRLIHRFLAGGLLLFAGGVVSVKMNQPPQLAVVFIAYFAIGFLLLPSLRFQMEWQRWQSLGIKPRETMVVPWVRAGLVLVTLAGIAALLLPTDFASGLIGTVQAIITFLVLFVQFVVLFLFWLITLPLRLLMGDMSAPPTPFVPPAVSPLTAQPSQAGNPLLDLIPKLLLVGLVIYIVVSYFRDHPELWALLKKLRIIHFLASIWQSVWRGTRTLTQDWRVRIPTTLPIRFRRRAVKPVGPLRALRLNSLSARERVLYFYLSTVRRAEDQGIRRAPVQTPHEFSATLKPSLPEVKDELDSLTDAFIEARYSQHPISSEQVGQTLSHWKRIQQALRAIGRAG